MDNKIINYIIGTIVVAMLCWIGSKSKKALQVCADARKIYTWLSKNTKDEPAESHKSLFDISNGIRITEERVRIACLRSEKIFQSAEQPGFYSIWRREPQSVYETRGLHLL
jgi:hypothetical protein